MNKKKILKIFNKAKKNLESKNKDHKSKHWKKYNQRLFDLKSLMNYRLILISACTCLRVSVQPFLCSHASSFSNVWGTCRRHCRLHCQMSHSWMKSLCQGVF